VNVERLVAMANDIGDFFKGESVREDAIAGIAGHLKRFWDPRMRKQIVAHAQAGGVGLNDLVKDAVARL
jgi:formate dehydrogenase subunit delta